MVREFDVQILEDLVYEKIGGITGDDVKLVQGPTFIEQKRWYTSYYIIFEDLSDNTFWKHQYQRGNTEYQEIDGPLVGEIECTRVVPVEKTVVEYRDFPYPIK